MQHHSLRVPDREWDLWKAEAQAQGLTLTALIRLRMSGGTGGLPAQVRTLAEREVERVAPSVVAEQAEHFRRELEALIDSAVERQLQGFDPVAFRYEIQNLVSQRGNGGRRGEIPLPSECRNADNHYQFSPEEPCPYCGETG